MSVLLSVEDTGPCRKQLKVEVPAPAVEAETSRVISELGRQVKIPGFRPGKVPASLIRQRFHQDIEREVVDRLLPRYWRQAEAESGLEPLLPPDVDEVRFEPGAPLVFLASVEVRPDIELGDLHDFDLPEESTEPTEAETAEAIEGLRRRAGTWVPVERPAARGDLVSAELTPLDGDEDEGPQSFEVEVGDPDIWEELSLALTGLAEGQEAEFTRRPPAADGAGEEAGEPRERRFKVRAVAVKERELPELDDDFATEVGDFENLDELRQALVANLRKSKRDVLRRKREAAMLEQLLGRHPMELPRRLVDREVEHLLTDYAENLSRRGIDVERSAIDWRDMGQQVRPQAERRVHTRLLLDAVADSEAIKVEEPELEAALASIARLRNQSTPAVRQALDQSGQLAALRAQLRRDKTIEHLLGEEPETAADPGSQSEGEG